MKPRNCTDCDKIFTTPATLRRHREAFHQQFRLKYQCWNCHRVYARKENVLKHSRQTHGDTDGKFIICSTTNQKYNPQITAPQPWTPPAEARYRSTATVYQVQVRSNMPQQPATPSDTDTKKQKSPTFRPYTIREMNKIYPITLEELQQELELTDSSDSDSDSSDVTDF